MDLSSVLYQNPVVVLREEFDEWAVLYNPDTAAAVGINPIGVAIWKAVDGRRTGAQVIEAVLEGYEEIPGTATDEVTQFITQLTADGFIGLQVEASPA